MVHALLLTYQQQDNDFTAMKDSKNIFKKLGLIGIGLCAACCLLPIGAVTFAVGATTVLNTCIAWAGLIAMVLALVFFGIYSMRKRQAAACETDCGCKA